MPLASGDPRNINWQVGMRVRLITPSEALAVWGSDDLCRVPGTIIDEMLRDFGDEREIAEIIIGEGPPARRTAFQVKFVDFASAWRWCTAMLVPIESEATAPIRVECETRQRAAVLKLHPSLQWLRPILKPINTVPHVTGDMFNVEWFDGSIREVSNISAEFLLVLPCEDGVYRHGDLCSTRDGITYSLPRFNELFGVCQICRGTFAKAEIHNGTCSGCRHLPEQIQAKSTPSAGWVKHGNGPVWFGIELEFMHANSPVECIKATLKTMTEEFNWVPPLVMCEDCSLGSKGRELDFHPMSMDYIKEHESKLSAFFKILYANGARNLDVHNVEKAGLHIHYSSKGCDIEWEQLLYKYEEDHRKFFVAMSGRTEDNYHYWCVGAYKCFGPRSNRDRRGTAGSTWEYRGFGANVLLDVGKDGKVEWVCFEDLVYLCEWVDSLAQATKDPMRFALSPVELVRAAGYTETADWIQWCTFDGATIESKFSVLDFVRTGAIKRAYAIWEASAQEYCEKTARYRLFLDSNGNRHMFDGTHMCGISNLGQLTSRLLLKCGNMVNYTPCDTNWVAIPEMAAQNPGVAPPNPGMESL